MRAAAAEDANQKASSRRGDIICYSTKWFNEERLVFSSPRAADDELSDEAFFNLLSEEGLTVLATCILIQRFTYGVKKNDVAQ